ncbi:MAG: type II secretion system minor pseudopilin GspH [Pseudomonadales bacterium]|nr:type II secretion system minor pseudopilin GspH [Pseudomonadales bacterium]
MVSPPKRRKAAGFTLIELMVVLVIMGVMISLVTLSSGIQNRDRETHQFAIRLISLMRLASDEAVLNGKLLAWRLNETEYQFMQLAEGKWVAVADDRLLKPNSIQPWISSEFEVEGRAVELLESAEHPQLLFLPSGEITSFRLDFFDKTELEPVRFRLENQYADLSLSRIDPDNE